MSIINPISAVGAGGLNTNLTKINAADNNTNSQISFKSVLEGLVEQADKADKADKAANFDLMTGEVENFHDVIIKGQEAELALALTVQIRNKLVDAYTEIMRMQV